jgi:glycosyltransferase involved in cell wall biosynthesis
MAEPAVEKTTTMQLSVLIPCFNEVRTLARVVQAVLASPVPSLQIVLVDDGSTDGTRDLLRSQTLGLREGLDKVIFHEHNQGKGAALRSAIAAADGDVMVIQDADLEYDPTEYPRALALIASGRADVVYGSRFTGSEAHRVVYFWHMVGNRFLTLLSNMFTDLNLTDMETGSKMFSRKAIEGIVLEEDRFGIEPELTAKFARKGCVFYEVGISYFGRGYAEGKKIGWKDGVRAIFAIVKYNVGR